MSDSEWTAERVAELRRLATEEREARVALDGAADGFRRAGAGTVWRRASSSLYAALDSGDDVLSLLDALESARKDGGWIAVTPETVPESTVYENRVLAMWMEGEFQRAGIVFWLSAEIAQTEEWQTEDGEPMAPGWYECAWFTDEVQFLGKESVLFWRPLPSPPVLP